MSSGVHASKVLLLIISTFLQGLLPISEAIQAIKCSNWYLKAPEKGDLTCDHQGEEAIDGTACFLTCEANFSPTHSEIICQPDGSWWPTKSPKCEADGSLTVIVVPAVVGTLILLFLAGFMYARMSNRCQTSKRTHEEVDVERGFPYPPRPGKEFAENHMAARDLESEYNAKSAKTTKDKRMDNKSKRRARRVPIRQRIRDKFRFSTPRDLWRERIGRLRERRWRSAGPKRVVGVPDGVGVSSVCGELELDPRYSDTYSDSVTSSCSEMEDSSFEPEMDNTPKQAGVVKTSGTKTAKVPPPRPPAPKIAKNKPNPRDNDGKHVLPVQERVGSKKNASSGYSSAEGDHKKHKDKACRSAHDKSQHTKRVSKKKSKDVAGNPYNHYPVAATDRKYLDFENDYRKTGHIYEAGAYHPQYHTIETFPIEPVHKKSEKHQQQSDRSANNDLNNDPRGNAGSTGGVKYYSIKPDHDDEKRMRRKREKHRSRSRSRSRRDRGRKKRSVSSDGSDGARHGEERGEHKRSRRRKVEHDRRRREHSRKRDRRLSSKNRQRRRSAKDDDHHAEHRKYSTHSKHHRSRDSCSCETA